MPTAKLLRFPRQPTFTPLRAYDAVRGEGAVVAMLFHLQVYDVQDPAGQRHKDGGHGHAEQAVVEGPA